MELRALLYDCFWARVPMIGDEHAWWPSHFLVLHSFFNAALRRDKTPHLFKRIWKVSDFGAKYGLTWTEMRWPPLAFRGFPFICHRQPYAEQRVSGQGERCRRSAEWMSGYIMHGMFVWLSVIDNESLKCLPVQACGLRALLPINNAYSTPVLCLQASSMKLADSTHLPSP